MKPVKIRQTILCIATAFAVCATPSLADARELRLPADCALGTDCFLQQFPDMDAGPGAMDPWCGPATYDGHDGIDLRLRSLKDMASNVPVVAVADGTVLRVRDGQPDQLVVTQADRTAVAGIECGNGLVMRNDDRIETQYCHLKQGSLVVSPGQSVKKGETLGSIGASGLAQFPHVHLTVRQNGIKIDPDTGREVGAGCADPGSGVEPLWDAATATAIDKETTAIIDAGLAGGPLDHESLVIKGAPETPDTGSAALVGWAWLINLKKGDTIELKVMRADGSVFANTSAGPMDRAKASYSLFAGKRGAPAPGAYDVEVRVMRAGETVRRSQQTIRVKNPA